jgi:GAF domain-containing protein
VSDDNRLAEVLVELADTLVDEFDVVEFLQRLTERCVELLEVDAAGLMLVDGRGNLQAIASSIESVRSLELFELQNREGPCLECFSTGRPIVNVDLERERPRWPVFAIAALEAGYRLSHALPMRLREQVIGAVNLFSTASGRELTGTELRIGQAMADIATIGLLNERAVRERDVLAAQLQSALDTRILIEQAKGVLAERGGIEVHEAFSVMRRYARSRGLSLTVVATSVINGTFETDTLTG